MAGDWIKMRGNLWDDPRVGAIVDATDTSEATVVGALYWLWATADQHSEDGTMPGLTLRQIDRKTGVPGFAAALIDVGWGEDRPEGFFIVKFEEHNGASAKKRCQTAKRVANHTAANAAVTPAADKTNAHSVSPALAREREEKEKSNSTSVELARAVAEKATEAMKTAGLADVSPSSPKLLNLLAAGITVEELTAAAIDAARRGKPAAYAFATAEGRRHDAKTQPLPAAAAADPDLRSAVEAEARAKGIGPWNEMTEQWPAYKARVRGTPVGPTFNLNDLAGMAANRNGAH